MLYMIHFELIFSFLRSLHTVPQWLHQLTFPPTVQEGSFFSTPSPAFVTCRLFNDGHSVKVFYNERILNSTTPGLSAVGRQEPFLLGGVEMSNKISSDDGNVLSPAIKEFEMWLVRLRN